jgi:hypothetical protein
MYTINGSKRGVLTPHRAIRCFSLGAFGIVLLLVFSRPAIAQQEGIGIFTEGERYAEIYVPGKPGEANSAPTIQDAIDKAKGPTFISVSLSESPGFLAEVNEAAKQMQHSKCNDNHAQITAAL